MGERRFLLYESVDHPNSIVKSELVRRLEVIAEKFDEEPRWSWDDLIDILLHGEKEQGWPGPEDILRMRGKIPAEDEWEAWIGKRPYSWGMREEIDQWFRKMPRNRTPSQVE